MDPSTTTNHLSTPAETFSSPFMKQVEETVANVIKVYGLGDSSKQESTPSTTTTTSSTSSATTATTTCCSPPKSKKPRISIDHIPRHDREAAMISRRLHERFQKARELQVCERCWLHRFPKHYCCCDQCPPIDPDWLPRQIPRRMFLILHYKEVFMGIDTAKLILAAFPDHCRLIISGISSEYQASMAELEESIQEQRVCILFPDEAARTVEELQQEVFHRPLVGEETIDDKDASPSFTEEDTSWDVVVIDGTWQQARRMKGHHFPPNMDSPPPSVKLSDTALHLLEPGDDDDDDDDDDNVQSSCNNDRSISALPPGHQLRKHSIPWKRIATFEALRLFLADCYWASSSSSSSSSKGAALPSWLVRLRDYVPIANQAALQQKAHSTKGVMR